MTNPYADDGVVYSVETVGPNHYRHTGRFYTNASTGDFWTMEVVPHQFNGSDWIALNPAHIVSVYAAGGNDFGTFTDKFGLDA